MSHVNLRAIQDGVPNAFIRDALQHPDIAPLLGSFVGYAATDEGWDLRAATPGEVDEHYESSRPTQAQTPQRNLSVTSITPLSNVRFEDWTAFGVKAANVAELGRLGFAAGTVPDGFAIPSYFYDEFMKHNNFYERIEDMLADPNFQSDFDSQDDMLDDLRDDIKDSHSPQWILDALATMHAAFPEGINRRYQPRSPLGPGGALLFPGGSYAVLSNSNLAPRGQLLMIDAQLEQLAQHLTRIHDHFEAPDRLRRRRG